MVSLSLSIPELLERLSQVEESREIEAKQSESELGKSALETISAFSNEPGMGGGYLLFGVVEDAATGRCVVKGIANPKKLEQELSTQCASAFNRSIRPRVWTEMVEGVALVAAFIAEASGPEKPVFIEKKGIQHGAYRRIGSTDQRCTEDDLRALFQASSSAPYVLEPRGKGAATHYVLGVKARPSVGGDAPAGTGVELEGDEQPRGLGGQTGGLAGQAGELAGQTGGLAGEDRGAPEPADPADLVRDLPPAMQAAIRGLGGKPAPLALRKAVVELCTLCWCTPRELATALGRRDAAQLSEKHLAALVRDGKLERRYPENLANPNQAYRARQPSLPGATGDEHEGE